MLPVRNNRIIRVDFLNRTCALGARFESMLLGDPPKNPFSTVSVKLRKPHYEQLFSAPAPITDMSLIRVAAGAFGFFTFTQAGERPER